VGVCWIRSCLPFHRHRRPGDLGVRRRGAVDGS